MGDQENSAVLRDQLRQLRVLAGKPSADNLVADAERCGHSVSRAALAGVTSLSSTGGLRWATVEAFIDACVHYAARRGKQLSPESVDKGLWRERFDTACPNQRTSKTRREVRQRVGLVPRLADCFQTRIVVAQLGSATEGGGTAVLTGAPTHLLTGLGGVGKTQLAAYFAERLWGQDQLNLLVWISATSRPAILAAYAQAAIDLAISGANGVDIERDAARFHAWLTTTDRRWLIVFDDLTRAADIQSLWPPANPAGRTVVTTRLREAALIAADRNLIQVGVFATHEATAYMKSRLREYPDLADDLSAVAVALGNLPLALSQATAFMINEQVASSEYRRRFDDRRRRLEDLVPPPDHLPDDYARTVAATLSLSIEAADTCRPAGLATYLLQLASVLDADGIPVSVFMTMVARDWLARSRAGDTLQGAGAVQLDVETVRSVMRCLHRLNLIDVDGWSVTLHGLVQRVMRDQFTDDRLASLAWIGADAVLEAWPEVERDPLLGQQLRACTSSLTEQPGGLFRSHGAHHVVFRCGHSLGDAGLVRDAYTYFEGIRSHADHRFGPNHITTFAARAGMAHWVGKHSSGESAYAAAEDYKDLLADQQRAFAPDHPDVLKTRAELVYWLGQAWQFDEAIAVGKELLADQRRVLGVDNPAVFETRRHVAHWAFGAGDVAQAVTAYEELLADQQRVLGNDHASTLKTREALAEVSARSDVAGTITANEELLADQERVLGADHPSTLETRRRLAEHYGWATGPDRAVAEFESLLGDLLRVLGPEHELTLGTRRSLGDWRARAGDSAGAIAEFEVLFDDMVRLYGRLHHHTQMVARRIAALR